MTSSDEYFSAEENTEDVYQELGFYLYTACDGTPWYLPMYYSAEVDLFQDVIEDTPLCFDISRGKALCDIILSWDYSGQCVPCIEYFPHIYKCSAPSTTCVRL